MLPADLAQHFRRKADELEPYAPGAAAAFRTAGDLAEQAWQDFQGEELTLAKAAVESGYSVAHLQRLVTEGKIPNVGRKNRPRVRRGDLPKKVTRRTQDARSASIRRRASVSAMT